MKVFLTTLKSVGLAALLLLAPAMTAGQAQEATQDPKASAKCVQAGLNAAGYSVGTVDGVIGNQTRRALKQYIADKKNGAYQISLTKGTQTFWCLWLVDKHQLGSEFLPLVAQVENNATVYINIDVAKEVSFKIELTRNQDTLVESASFKRVKVGSKYVHGTTFRYADVRNANKLCVTFSDGWMVKDRSGKMYQASCDPRQMSLFTFFDQSNAYSVAREGN